MGEKGAKNRRKRDFNAFSECGTNVDGVNFYDDNEFMVVFGARYKISGFFFEKFPSFSKKKKKRRRNNKLRIDPFRKIRPSNV